MMAEGNISTAVLGSIATITFSYPAHNALPLLMLEELAKTITTLSEDETIHMIVLRSGGDRTFCAGADFQELTALNTHEEAQRFFMGFAQVIYAMITSRVPIMAYVQGKAVGGALGLIAAADHVVASQYASLKMSELSLGIGPFVIAPVIKAKTSIATFSKMLWEPMHWQTADWALQCGLYHKVCKTTDQAEEYLKYWSSFYADYHPEALMENKKLVWGHHSDAIWEDMKQNAAITARLVLTEYTQKKLRSFLKS